MLKIDLKGKRAFVAGVGDDQGYGWAIAKALAEAGCEVLIGTWTPLMRIFTQGLASGKFDESRRLNDGTLLEFAKIYPLDAAFDRPDDVPQDIRENKRYLEHQGYTISEVVEKVKNEFGTIDYLIHSLANAPEVQKPLLETSRQGYLAAFSASSYSFIALLSQFGPIMNPEGATLSLSYYAAEKAIPGYGGGMSSAKAALESDTKALAFEAGRKWNIRVNTISAGPYRSRAARAIGFVDRMIAYSVANAPLTSEVNGDDVGHTAAFLVSPLARGITGSTVYVDCGLHAMGMAVDSSALNSVG